MCLLHFYQLQEDYFCVQFCIGGGFFMHCSTASGEEVGGAQMQSRRINPKTQFSVPFSIYCHSPGPPPHWQLYHIPLKATSPFQVEFEVSIRAGNSSGGIQADDIDLLH